MNPNRRLPLSENPPQSNRPPENRPSARMPPPALAHPSIREVLSLPPPSQPQPPPPPSIDDRSEGEAVPLSPAAARVEPRAERGGPMAWIMRSEHDEAPRSQAVAMNLSKPEETATATATRVENARPSSTRRSRREEMVQKAALGFRVSGLVFCLISFSVMAADKTQGWAGDSYERYKEYRYCISVTIIGFVYSGFQAYALTHHLMTVGKHLIPHPIHYYFDFSLDQILAYLLMSSSSSAATRTDSWVSNWGEDEFTKKATASVGMSFLAFIAFAFSALISGYNLCTRNY
ncbi:CASP-like protein 4A3 [Cinnamomum micranthum f. kanehirae]|uniref:CASP-like protein n=1 Tax=Cinnamomum micranthum f. kanehirae TaxID=337451 RepID=A0A443P498_9MAGN|nr:CASP-like protein 4A3 [Cinnamomum micranthum f. kanehirae]